MQPLNTTPLPPKTTRAPRPRRRAAAAVAILAGLATLGMNGCDAPSGASAALEEASALMAQLSASASTPASREFARDSVYQRIVSTLEPVQGQGTETEQAAARLLLAQARIGLADQPFAEASAAQARVLNRVAIAQGSLSSYVRLGGHAAALERFDPRDTLADLRERTSRLDRERQDTIAERDELAAEIAGLREQAEARNDDARRLRDAVAEVRLRAARQTATEAAEMLAGVRGQTREADRLEMEGADLLAQADLLDPALNELRIEIERIEAQEGALVRAGDRVQATTARGTEDARTARDEADRVARDLATQIDELLRLHAEEAEPNIEETVSGLERAVSLANQAARELRSGARATAAQASQSLAHTHAQAASTLTRVAGFLESAASATPALPQADRYRRTASELRDRARTHREAAEAADQAAEEGFVAAGVRRGADEPALAGDYGDEWSDSGVVGTEDSVRDFLAELEAANSRGDMDFIADAIVAEGPIMERMVREMRPFLEAFARLNQITEDAFGRSFSEYLASPEAAQSGSMTAMMFADGAMTTQIVPDAGGGDAQIDVFGDEALVTIPGTPVPTRLRMRDGRWAILMSDDAFEGMEDMMPEGMLDAITDAYAPMARAMDDLAQRVERGQLESEQAVLTAFEGEMMTLMMRLMGGGD
ncbi:MAG: hypothetical protein EA378_09840 [Phycisphaerales bacterium]|nr:MAG: hypothetical protein EA378_09840 [Phycisphaerales bacterium]